MASQEEKFNKNNVMNNKQKLVRSIYVSFRYIWNDTVHQSIHLPELFNFDPCSVEFHEKITISQGSSWRKLVIVRTSASHRSVNFRYQNHCAGISPEIIYIA